MPCRDHTSKALRYGTRSQGISHFYLHTLRTFASGMNHTCLCLPSRSWYSIYTTLYWQISHTVKWHNCWQRCDSNPVKFMYTHISYRIDSKPSKLAVSQLWMKLTRPAVVGHFFTLLLRAFDMAGSTLRSGIVDIVLMRTHSSLLSCYNFFFI